MNATVTVLTQTKNELVIMRDNTPAISHLIIADKTNNDKVSIRKLIDNYSEQLNKFGRLSFEMTPLKTNWWVQETKQYFLNENQATFLMTLLKNNEIVVNFKLNLVKAFSDLRQSLQQLLPPFKNSDVVTMIEQLNKDKSELIKTNKELLEYKNTNERRRLVAWDFSSKFVKWMVDVATEWWYTQRLIQKQEEEIKTLKAENNKYKALWTAETKEKLDDLLMSVEEVGVKLNKSRNKLFQLLRFKRFLKKDNAPYKKYDWEYFIQKKVKYGKWKNKNVYMQTFITPKWFELLKRTFG